jgi:hypothetical protein
MIGIGSQPMIVISLPVQDGPVPHGSIRLGTIPKYWRTWNAATSPPMPASEECVAPDLRIGTPAGDSEDQRQRKHERPLEPAKNAGRLPHDLADEERTERRRQRHDPGGEQQDPGPLARSGPRATCSHGFPSEIRRSTNETSLTLKNNDDKHPVPRLERSSVAARHDNSIVRTRSHLFGPDRSDDQRRACRCSSAAGRWSHQLDSLIE